MNRLAPPTSAKTNWHSLIPTPPPSAIGGALAPAQIRPAVESPTTTFLPSNYEAGYAYPLLVWLHDSGGNERHLPQVMHHLSTQNYVAVAPRAPRKRQVWGQHDHEIAGYEWVQEPNEIADAEQAVDEAVEHAKVSFNVHPDRVFLLGHGQGGSMAMRLALQSPRIYAGVASISGSLPYSHRPLRQINQLRDLPFFIASARECPQYRETDVCRDLKLLHAAGCSVALRQYPGDDDLTTIMLKDVNRWLMD
ncbi:MAG: alpha/beta hydrolase, partial [Aeoliella sp.]